LDQAEVLVRVDQSLIAVGLPEHGPRNPSQLSTGERKRVCLAGVLACDPAMLVLDEPTSNLDPRARRQLLEILRRFPGTQIIATHDLDFALELCPRVLVLDGGKLQADGPVEQVLANPNLMERHGLEVPWRLRAV
jgi:cobalt/nickel transport system ATP-binding protein